jgi:hypothetical protein
MKIHLELHSDTLTDVRAELEAFLSIPMTVNVTAPTANDASVKVKTAIDTASTGTAQASPTRTADTATATASAAGALGIAAAETVARSVPPPAPRGRQTRSAADIALGLDADGDARGEGENDDAKASEDSRQSDIEQLLADKAQLQFDFDRVLALQGRAAALGIVQGVLPVGVETKLKDIETLPVALIPAAIAALQAAQAD